MVTADVDCAVVVVEGIVAGVAAGIVVGAVAVGVALEDGAGVGAAGLVTEDEEALVPPAPVSCPNAIHCVPSCLGHLNAHAQTPG